MRHHSVPVHVHPSPRHRHSPSFEVELDLKVQSEVQVLTFHPEKLCSQAEGPSFAQADQMTHAHMSVVFSGFSFFLTTDFARQQRTVCVVNVQLVFHAP